MKTEREERLEYARNTYTTGTIFRLAHLGDPKYTFEITDDHYIDEWKATGGIVDLWVFSKITKERIMVSPGTGYCAVVYCEGRKERSEEAWGQIEKQGETLFDKNLREVRRIINTD